MKPDSRDSESIAWGDAHQGCYASVSLAFGSGAALATIGALMIVFGPLPWSLDASPL
jgi:hypothetical protein